MEPIKTYERGRFICNIYENCDPVYQFKLIVTNKLTGNNFGVNKFKTEQDVMSYLENTYFELAEKEKKPYRVYGYELDLPRDGSQGTPESDGGGIEYFDTLDEAIEVLKELREDEYADGKIVGDNVPSEYANFLNYFTI